MALTALQFWSRGDDIWSLIFDLAEAAARAADASDLVPHWIAPGQHKVQRHVPQLPYTTEVEAFNRLEASTRRLPRRLRSAAPRGATHAARPIRSRNRSAQGLGGRSRTADQWQHEEDTDSFLTLDDVMTPAYG